MDNNYDNKKKHNFKFLFAFAKNHMKYLVLSLIGTVLSIVFMAIMPQIIRVTIDSIIDDVPYDLPQFIVSWIESNWTREELRDSLYIPAILAILFSILAGIANYVRKYYAAVFAEGTVKDIRDSLFANIQKLPYSWHIKMQTGDIIQRCTSDVETIKTFLTTQLLEFIRVAVLIVVYLFLMISLSPKLAIIPIAMTPIIIGYSLFFFYKTGKQYMIADEAEGELMAVAQENLTGVRVVRAFGREAMEVEKFNKKNNFFANIWLELGKILSVYWGVGDFVTGIQAALVLYFGTKTVLIGEIDVGELIAFSLYNSSLIWPVRGLGRLISEMSRTEVSVVRVRDILDSPPEVDGEDDIEPEIFGEIEFRNVSFKYNEKLVLDNINLTIAKGSTLAILGGTGSGKSTFAHLLARLYDCDDDMGNIYIDGVNIKNIKREYLRKNVGLVLQEPFLFSKTIIDNVKAASKALLLDEIRDYSKLASVDGNIMSFPNQYDTIVGERGVTLSGGQKQRIAIARMLASSPKIMIFDDSFSAIDTETDAKIRANLKQKIGQVTTVLISHRATTLMQADKIIVLDSGRIIEEGTHAQLMELGGIYAKVNDIQSIIEDELR